MDGVSSGYRPEKRSTRNVIPMVHGRCSGREVYRKGADSRKFTPSREDRMSSREEGRGHTARYPAFRAAVAQW